MQLTFQFDVRAVALFVAMTFFVQATAIGAQAFLIRDLKQYRGVGAALLANLCVATGLMLRLFADQLPEILSILLSIVTGYALALWDVLIGEGYRTTGLYLDLGIFDYSVESRGKCEAFAAARGVPLIVTRVEEEVGAPVPVIKQVTRRPPCAIVRPGSAAGAARVRQERNAGRAQAFGEGAQTIALRRR